MLVASGAASDSVVRKGYLWRLETMSQSCIAVVCCAVPQCKKQEGYTYHSAVESVRAEPGLLPAAAEAKEAGAIVVVEREVRKVRWCIEA